jgi:hypothetical protein
MGAAATGGGAGGLGDGLHLRLGRPPAVLFVGARREKIHGHLALAHRWHVSDPSDGEHLSFCV